MDGKNKLQSIIKQVQSTTTKLGFKDRLSIQSSANSQNQQSSSGTQLDLDSAIEYNRYLINSYLEERNSRELPLYERIVAESKDSEDQIIESIEKEFFLEQQTSQNDEDNSSIIKSEELQSTNCDNLEDSGDNSDLIQSKILEICVLQKLPEFNPQVPNLFLNYIDLEKKKLQKQVTIVSKRLSDMIVENQQPLSEELNRVNLIDSNVQCAIETCGSGRHSLSYTKRDFTSKSLTIVENYSQRESIIKVIKCLLNIKTIQTTIEHIQNLLEYEKNFPSAIRLYYETCHILEEMAPKYACVEEMRAKLSQMLNMAEEQMDSVLAKLPDRFCRQTYEQLCEAYRQIGKSEKLIHQLLMHFNNTIYEKAFSIVHGYVKLFSELSISSTSTPVKSKGKSSDWAGGTQQTPQTSVNESRDFDLKRKPFPELCQYLKPESFLSCLTDLCRAMWDIMQNYHQIVLFYRSEGGRKSNKSSEESKDSAAAIEFAQTKLRQGVLRVWSDIQHKIRTIISSVKFVDSNTAVTDDDPSKLNETAQNDSFVNSNERSFGGAPVHQDQLLFSFEEFIKILTVCEKMIEIGEEFCSLYEEDANGNRNCFDSTLQNTLYQQTRAYFQSYHQVSMAELRIFLENETWTRCPIESHNEFQLIANLQEFSFIKHRLLKLNRNFNEESNEKSTTATATAAASSETIVTPRQPQQLPRSSSSSYLLSPTSAKTKHYFFTNNNNKSNTEIEEEDETIDDTDSNVDNCLFSQTQSPFDDIFVLLTDTKVRYDSDSESSDYNKPEEEGEEEDFEMILKQQQRETNLGTEIVTTNTALNVIRLIGRYMHIMYLLRPISHDIIKALLELFDYYFFTVYRFFAIDPLNAAWLTPFLTSMLHHQSGSIELNVSSSSSSSPSTLSQTLPVPSPTVQTPSSSNTPILNHLSTELRSFIRRINETLIINPESQSQSTGLSPTTATTTSSHNNQSFNKSSSDSALMALHLASSSSPGSSPKRIVKHPCPMLPSYVAINEPNNLWALGERIMAIQSLIFISRQFYNLCPFLLDFLRKEESLNESTLGAATPTAGAAATAATSSNDTKEKIHHKKSVEDGFKMLQFYHDQMCLNVESLLYQCLLAVSTKLLPYDSIIASMCQIKWDLKEIPSIHSNYVDCFVESIRKFNDQYLQLLKNCDLEFLLPINHNNANTSNRSMTNECQNSSEPVIGDEEESEDLIPLSKLDLLSKKLNQLLWECIVRISNRSFVEGFSTAKKCTNEGRALMQLDYQQFLSHIEKIMSPYFGSSSAGTGGASGVRAAKALLSTEKEFVEEYVKAYYLTDAIFIDWIRQRPDYTTKQIVSLIHCLTHDNRKQRSFLLAAVDTSSIELPIAAPSSIS